MRHAWIAGLLLFGLAPGGNDDERGIQLYQQGQYAEAAAAFRAAIEAEGPSAERAYNLALALWKAKDFDGAETAAEEAATLSDGALDGLRDGLLGNLRYAAAEAKQAEDLQGALELAQQAKAHFLRGALAPGARPELARNLERALKLIDDLQKKIDEQKKQEKKDDQKKDDQKKDDQQDQQKKDQNKDENKDQQKQDQNQDQNKQDQQPGEPKEQEQPQEPKPDEQEQKDQQQKDQQQQPPPAPGEQQEGRELTPEEKKRLLEKLKELDAMRLQLREQQKARRPVVEKDW